MNTTHFRQIKKLSGGWHD